MSLVGFRAQNHPQQIGVRNAIESRDDRATDPDLFAALHAEFRFTVDAAASPENAKLERFFSIENSGLENSWAGERVWCNPPYSNIGPWVENAWRWWRHSELIVMLLPANRTEKRWWQDHVEPSRDRTFSPLSTRFLPGRPRFVRPGMTKAGPNERPPFGCVLLIWRGAA